MLGYRAGMPSPAALAAARGGGWARMPDALSRLGYEVRIDRFQVKNHDVSR